MIPDNPELNNRPGFAFLRTPDKFQNWKTTASPMPQSVRPSAKKKGFFKKGGGFWDVLGTIGDALTGNPVHIQSILDRRRQEREAMRRYGQWAPDMHESYHLGEGR